MRSRSPAVSFGAPLGYQVMAPIITGLYPKLSIHFELSRWSVQIGLMLVQRNDTPQMAFNKDLVPMSSDRRFNRLGINCFGTDLRCGT